ncbi:MAG TPA: PKD domain-containing protein [Candidatus Angelobacter sp.]|nr:PKD domain-containing protein [Candidatus Angelobacter sp.]
MRHQICIVFFSILLSMPALAGTAFKASTTLTAETSSNTSTASSFATQTNGNIGQANISKVPTRTLLYPGSTAKIYAHFVPWFGFGDHMNVGYVSSDILQLQKQVNDMVSRGFDGAVIDWYGRGESNAHFVSYDKATQGFMHQSELHAGFNFAIMHDAGAIKTCAATVGCDVTQTMIDDLNYANVTYFNSPAYLHSGGRPVVYLFGHEAYNIDWTRLRAGIAGNPLLIFRNGSGFTKAQTGGAFSWVAPEAVSATNLMAISYLDGYYKTALAFPTEYSTGSGYKGFNDSLAAWGTGRLIGQQCGQTWLQSLADASKYYSATKQMFGIQLVTWNDYEEGTEIETGIDNCVTVTAAVAATTVSWSITGQMNTVDHFSVFVSQDGENLMWLADTPTSVSSLNLASFNLNSGNYIVFVKAVGKPSLTNKMSAGVQLTVSNQPPIAALSITPPTAAAPTTVSASTAGSSDPDGTVVSSSINFGDGSAAVSGASATHTYKVTGTYTITASVTDNLGATTKKSATVAVTGSATTNKPPVAAISTTPASAYGPVTVSVNAAGSSDPDGTIASVALSFGDGSTASGLTASHTYSNAGVYTVTAKVTDNQGASSTASTTVTVKAPEVIVSSPANTASVVSSVNVIATGFSGNPVTAMQIYRDSVLIYTIHSANLNTTVALAAGTHNLVIKGWDNGGRNFAKTLTVTASQTAASQESASSGTVAVTTVPKVVVSSPANGDQVLSSVHVVAEGFSNHRIMAMQIYRDYKLIYSVHSPNLNATIGLTTGKHLLAVKGWDSSGRSFMKLLNVTASR